jgi:hypothetical protein
VPAGKERVYNPSAPSAEPVKKKGLSKLILIAGITIIVAGLGVLGFMFVKPLFSTPVVPEIIPEEIPAVIPEEEITEEESSPVETLTHVSFFSSPADSAVNVSLGELTLGSFKEAVFPVESEEGETATEPLASGSVQELVVSSPDGALVFADFVGITLPDMNAEAMALAFEEDFTLFAYQDGTNRLLGFVAKVNNEAEPEALAGISKALEESPNLVNFYAVDPGTMSAFKEGSVSGDPVRYASFSTAGYAFNYGWFKDASGADYLVGASSYKTITEAIKRAGF